MARSLAACDWARLGRRRDKVERASGVPVHRQFSRRSKSAPRATPGGRMQPRTAAVALAGLALAAVPARAQDADPPAEHPTPEQMIEVAREAWRPPGLRRRCPPPTA